MHTHSQAIQGCLCDQVKIVHTTKDLHIHPKHYTGDNLMTLVRAVDVWFLKDNLSEERWSSQQPHWMDELS